MELFTKGELNVQAFDEGIRKATEEFSSVIFEVAQKQSPCIQSTHFLIALAVIPDGVTAKFLSKQGFLPEQWRTGLLACAPTDANCLPPTTLSQDYFDDTALKMLQTAEDHRVRYNKPTISEGALLVSALQHVTSEVKDLFVQAGIDLDEWCSEIERSIQPVTPTQVFGEDPPGALLLESFTPAARKVLKLVRSETQALGHTMADPRHLLLALTLTDGGLTQYALRRQGVTPRRVQEGVMLSLRRTVSRKRTSFEFDSDHFQPLVRRILKLSGDLAARDSSDKVGESHILRSFLSVETVARRILSDEGVDIDGLSRVVEGYCDLEQTEQEIDTDTCEIGDVESIRDYMRSRLVGQDEAIQRILPYVQRSRFGFSIPGRPVGVFLFCGPSGSGKTEMAKALAASVYGSEENLVFLEMGQFNSRESINVFVGAPPGYVGYGEGKLTNGLRDKPQSVVLIDEVEKAHNLVLDALLRFLDEGRIDDPAGPVRDGSQCIVVLTSNVAARELNELWTTIEGVPNWRAVVRRKLRELFEQHKFRLEFLNRVDELILFRKLKAADYAEIARRLLVGYLGRLENERQIHVEYQNVCEAIGTYCEQVDEGARGAHRLVMSMVITPVIDYTLRHQLRPPIQLHVMGRCDTGALDCEPYGVVRLVT
jgi:ATP-dependent Clp protease ATP-binding subunit ClpA